MNAPRLSELLEGAAVVPVDALTVDPTIRGVQLDSRRVDDGDLFFALKGEQLDGERFVPQAVERGAAAIVAGSARPATLDPAVAWIRVERPRGTTGPISREFFGRPDEALTLVGVTGTNGKTTVTYMVQAIAAAAGRRAGRIGTTGFAFLDEQQPLERTTPEATDLFALLDRMRRGGADLVAMEVSSHALSLGRVDSARFAVAAFLNLTRDHLDYYADEEAYFDAKASLFDGLDEQAHGVVPDSHWGGRIAARTQARLLRFGRSDAADVRLSAENCRADGSSATIASPAGSFEIEIAMPGRFNLDNAAAAAACALHLGIAPDAIADGLRGLSGVPGRVQRIDRGQPFDVWVDYAHTPDALERMLEPARELTAGRLLVVYGCGGDRDRGKRVEMGRAVARHADVSFITSDNPRGEDPNAIIAQVRAGAEEIDGAEFRCHADRRESIAAAFAAAEPGDLVVVAGKGHETTQDIAGERFRFDDREVATAALDALLGGRHA